MSSRVWLPASSSLVLGPWSGAHLTRCIASPLPPLRPHCPAVMRCFVSRHRGVTGQRFSLSRFFPAGKAPLVFSHIVCFSMGWHQTGGKASNKYS